MLWSLRKLLWWLQEKLIWPVADALRGGRGGPASLDEAREKTGPSELTGGSPVAPLICLAAAIAASGAILLIYQSHLIFFVDDWDVLIYRRGSSAADFLDPHNHHINLALIAIYKALLALFGMTSALPFQIVSTLVFLLSVVLLFVYVRRRVGGWLALLASILILFLGAAWTDLLFSFNITFFGSMAAGIGSLLALDRDDRRGDLVACALLVVATSFGELGVPFVVAALVSVALGPWPRLRRLYVPLVPAVLYGLWYLGWGHTAGSLVTFHNIVNSPRFVFDAISQNLASLLGLATPLNRANGVQRLRGLTWGRILFVIAIALAIWRVWKVGRPSRSLWVVLALGLSYWFLTALNADIQRTPTTGRYQYQGAIFVILIAAEFLRGVPAGRRFLAAATAVTAAAAISGLIFLHYGYQRREFASDRDGAKLAAVDIARPQLSDDFVINLTTSTAPIDAGSYFSAVDAFGSPAVSESQLSARDGADRAAADQLLAPAEGVRLRPVPPAGRAQPSDRCQTVRGSRSGSAAVTVGPGDYTLSAREPPGGTAQVVVPIEAARFAERSSVNLGFLDPRTASALNIPADNSSRPWRLYLPAMSEITLCVGAAPRAAPGSTPSSPATAPSNALPDLVGLRLDIAEQMLRARGISFRAVGRGGNVLPIVVTKNWTVCRTMPGVGAQSEGPVALVVARAAC